MSDGFDFSDLYQNEESVDISTYMTSANLELCEDELFQSLFPTSPEPPNVKSEKPDPFETELDWWTDPGSACSSAAQSPVPFFNTPPVTPNSKAPIKQELGQFYQQDHLSQISMSRTQITPINGESRVFIPVVNEKVLAPNQVQVKTEPDPPQTNQLYYVKNELDTNNNNKLLPTLIKVPPPEITRPTVNEVYISTLKRSLAPSNEQKVPQKKSKLVPKNSEEYKIKRERNNIAVRKSRDKAKLKSMETEQKVDELSSENKKLHARVAELTHELNTLKGILKSLPQAQSTN